MNNKIKKSKKNLTKEKKNKSLKKQTGKGLFNRFIKPVNNLKLSFKKAKSSETRLINAYEKLTKSVDDYYKLYNSHLENLIQLDTFLNNSNFETLFKNIVIKEHFKKHDIIDKSLPLLLRNFNVGDDTSSTALRRESLIKQIRYKIHITFPEREQLLFKEIDVKINPDGEVIMIIKTVENKDYKRNVKHDNFILNMAFLNRELKDVMKVVKENLQYESNIYKLNNNNYSMINSNNIYKSSQNKKMSRKKSSSRKNMLFGNNMVKIVDENSNTNKKSQNSGQSFDIFNILKSGKNQNKNRNKPRFQNRAFNKKEIKFDLGKNLVGPEFKGLGANKGPKNNNSPESKPNLKPKQNPIEGFLPPNMKGLEFVKNTDNVTKGTNTDINCEDLGNDLSSCKLHPKCRFDYTNQMCVNK
jgi:hypothetical protein